MAFIEYIVGEFMANELFGIHVPGTTGDVDAESRRNFLRRLRLRDTFYAD
jgi:hypothetical protein